MVRAPPPPLTPPLPPDARLVSSQGSGATRKRGAGKAQAKPIGMLAAGRARALGKPHRRQQGHKPLSREQVAFAREREAREAREATLALPSLYFEPAELHVATCSGPGLG